MKVTLYLTAVLFAVAMLGAGYGKVVGDQQILESASESALTQARDAIDASDTVADGLKAGILPLVEKDGSDVTSALKIFAGESKLRVFARSREEWDKILTEAEFAALREDLMNPKSVLTGALLQQLQPIEGLDGVIVGEVLDHGVGELEARVRVQLFLFDVRTGEQLWQGTFTGTAPRHPVDVTRPYWKYVLYVVIALLVVALISRFVKAASRPR